MKWFRMKNMPCMPIGKDGKKITACQEHIDLSRTIAAEGMVLLKNNDKALPLQLGERVAVFGKAQYDYVQVGGGSGDVTTPYVRNIYNGLKIKASEGKILLYDELIDFYENEVNKQYMEGIEVGHTTEPEIPEDLLKRASALNDTAIITICRFSRENRDRTAEPYDGDYYLTHEEEKMIKDVTENFQKVIVVINAGAQIDSNWFHDNDKITAVLYTWQAGMEGGLAIADILCGDVTPSGKLVDTFARDINDYPSTEGFFESDVYVKYPEDIYVGYRYFETIPGAAKKVNYPFGFGLSYTEFETDVINIKEENGKIRVQANVTNIGSVSGKEVLQLYFSAPQGILGKPKLQLCAFKKTAELAPGETRTYFLEFTINQMASYDDLGKVQMSAYVLEKGTYTFHLGNSIRNTKKLDFEYVLENNVIVEQLTQQAAPNRLEKRMLANGTFEEMPSFENNTTRHPIPENQCEAPAEHKDFMEVVEKRLSMDAFLKQLSDEQLIALTAGIPKGDIARTMGGIPEFGIPGAIPADGPQGLHFLHKKKTADYDFVMTFGMYATSFPCATLVACTWEPEWNFKIGVAGAKEVKENNRSIWLTPALNIHRNPLSGRNFEYYSEDPLISGIMAAASVKGIQSQQIAATPKHFCANNKETNRRECDSIVSERALREIYLKGFEICIKESDPWIIMSSYNWLNGVRVSENYDVLMNILRYEWGYKGMITGDWLNTAHHPREIKAGNDIKMHTGQPEEVKKALEEGWLTRREIEVCVARILEMLIKLD